MSTIVSCQILSHFNILSAFKSQTVALLPSHQAASLSTILQTFSNTDSRIMETCHVTPQRLSRDPHLPIMVLKTTTAALRKPLIDFQAARALLQDIPHILVTMVTVAMVTARMQN